MLDRQGLTNQKSSLIPGLHLSQTCSLSFYIRSDGTSLNCYGDVWFGLRVIPFQFFCDQDWNDSAAKVVCRSLGFESETTRAISTRKSAFYSSYFSLSLVTR